MKFTETKLRGAYLVQIERVEDERGYFARGFCRKEFERMGLNPCVAQCNISFNKKRGTLRGMHFQAPPHGEAKLVRCTRGAIYDVIVDLRTDSATYCRWHGVELTQDDNRLFYVPEGFAHGYQTLEDDTEVFYLVSELYHPESERGARFNDPAFDIRWPLAAVVISPKDRGYPDWSK